MNAEQQEAKCCLCFPLGCGTKTLALILIFQCFGNVALGIYETGWIHFDAGWPVLMLSLPFLYIAYLLIKFMRYDNDINRDGLIFGAILFVFSFIIYNITAVVLDNYYNIRLPMGAPGAYPDSAIKKIIDKHGEGSNKSKLMIEELQENSMKEYRDTAIWQLPLMTLGNAWVVYTFSKYRSFMRDSEGMRFNKY